MYYFNKLYNIIILYQNINLVNKLRVIIIVIIIMSD